MTQVGEHLQNLQDILHKDSVGAGMYLPEFHHILDEIRLSLDKQDSDGAVIAIIRGALELRASDVHLELHEVDSSIRFRIDGDLATV